MRDSIDHHEELAQTFMLTNKINFFEKFEQFSQFFQLLKHFD